MKSRVLFVLALASCSGSGLKHDDRPLVAKVDGVPVYVEEFRREFRRIRLDAQSGLPEAGSEQAQKTALLSDLVNRRLLMADAEKKNVIVSTNDIEAAYTKARSGWKEEEFLALLTEKDMTPAEFKSELREQLLIRRYFRDHVFSRVAVTDQEISTYLEAHPELVLAPEQVRALQIVVKTREEASKIFDEIKAGMPFEDAAMKYSLSPDGKNGGDLGFFARGTMPTIFDEVCFALKPGEVSKVVDSDYGFHLFKVLEFRPARQHSVDDVRAQIEKTLRREKEQEAEVAKVAELREAAKVDIQEEELAHIH